MKKFLAVLLVLVVALTLAGCGEDEQASGGSEAAKSEQTEAKSAIDIDLYDAGYTLAYPEIYSMYVSPSTYIGKVVRLKGTFLVNDETNPSYFFCMIYDPTGCCSISMEFVLGEAAAYPADFPALGSTISVTGTFATYYEGIQLYCHLVNSTVTVV